MLMLIGLTVVVVLTVAAVCLQVLRRGDRRADERAAAVLMHSAALAPQTFDPAMVADLPEPARRYFAYAIQPGTPLRMVAEVEMTGELGLGSRERANYLPMTGRQVLRLDGFVWQVRAGAAAMWVSGSDGYVDAEGWTRFWLYDAIPVARAGGGDDFARSAAGRAVAESLFWTPAALLPSPKVRWEAVSVDTSRAIVSLAGHEHHVELTVAADGRPLSVSLMRWSRENPEKRWRLQPFGGTIRSMMEVDGYRVAEAVEGGNWFGAPDYFPFYRARVTRIQLHPG
ncbi:DUF6544 family protein [Phenylobacterium sp.]|jgi:hypothetical protein|uniref:DUF6544 family protein n=1 Tax=Phenylobacterium sp. TaxID=1871053 RepID=UPI002F92514C